MNYSGKFVVRVPLEVHRDLKKEAHARGISLNELCVERLSKKATSGSEAWWASFWREIPATLLSKAGLKARGFDLVGLVLFGSFPRGQSDSSSDIDLLLVLPTGGELSRDCYTRWDRGLEPLLRSVTHRRVSPQFVTLPKNLEQAGSLWLEVAREGIILWEENLKLSTFLHGLRSHIESRAFVRKESHGQPYWVRNS